MVRGKLTCILGAQQSPKPSKTAVSVSKYSHLTNYPLVEGYKFFDNTIRLIFLYSPIKHAPDEMLPNESLEILHLY